MDQVLIFKNTIGEIYVENGLIFSIKVDDPRVENTIIYHLDKIFDLVIHDDYILEGDDDYWVRRLVFYTYDAVALNDSYPLTQALEKVKEILNGYAK